MFEINQIAGHYKTQNISKQFLLENVTMKSKKSTEFFTKCLKTNNKTQFFTNQ